MSGTDRPRVLLPRARPDDPLAVAVAEAGLDPVPTALVTTVPVQPGHLDRTLGDLAAGRYAWLAVTSATTVEVLADRAAARGSTPAELVGPAAVAAVGPATADALFRSGIAVALRPTGPSSAADLVRAWPARAAGEPARVLWPRSAQASTTLADGLRERGWDVDDVVAYDTVTAPPDPALAEDLAAGEIDAVLLTSGSTAAALAESYEKLSGIRVVAIGPVTAETAERAGLTVHAVAAEQSPAGLVEALRSLDPELSANHQEQP
ncbi:hypothetical protein GCM10023169_27140 [Georgenia halophila]|uniref:Uroporphyrinogen-III synthase n=1 Tax=Georgenia halophila TaxID=620889 RepID=A0ABP8LEY2_9MICO